MTVGSSPALSMSAAGAEFLYPGKRTNAKALFICFSGGHNVMFE